MDDGHLDGYMMEVDRLFFTCLHMLLSGDSTEEPVHKDHLTDQENGVSVDRWYFIEVYQCTGDCVLVQQWCLAFHPHIEVGLVAC